MYMYVLSRGATKCRKGGHEDEGEGNDTTIDGSLVGAAASAWLACSLGMHQQQGRREGMERSMNCFDYAASSVASVINVAVQNRRFIDMPRRGYDRPPSSSSLSSCSEISFAEGSCYLCSESLTQRFVTGRQVEMDREACVVGQLLISLNFCV